MNDFLILVKQSADYGRYSPAEMQRHLEDILAWIDSLKEADIYRDVRRLNPDRRVIAAHSLEVTDGPFTETKEVVSGFFHIVARDMEHALEIARGCPSTAIGCDLEVREFRPLADQA